MLRLFTCVWVPDNIRGNIVKFQEKMRQLPLKAKFVEPENLHITITFLGNITGNKLNELIENFDAITENVKKFHVKVETLKIIPNEEFIRVIGINILNGQKLADLIKKIGCKIDGKYYESTKLTLCRVKKIFDKQKIKDFIEKNRNIKMGKFDIEGVSLVKSTLSKGGPVYETLHTSKLK